MLKYLAVPIYVPLGKKMTAPSTTNSIANPHALGALLRGRRKAQRLTLEDLSGLSGLGVRFLSELERGKPTAELGKAMLVLATLGLELYAVPRAQAAQIETALQESRGERG